MGSLNLANKSVRLALSCLVAIGVGSTQGLAQSSVEIGGGSERCAASRVPAAVSPSELRSDILRLFSLVDASSNSPWLLTRPSGLRLPGACNATPFPWLAIFAAQGTPGAALKVLPNRILTQYNTAFPRYGDPAGLRVPRGISTELRGGVAAEWGPLSARIAPVMRLWQNRAFQHLPVTGDDRSKFAHPRYSRNFDWPQRFGNESNTQISPGASTLRLDVAQAALGISTERIRWGGARHYPLLVSGAAPGFPHAFIGSSEPVDIWIGSVGAEALWGRLEESDFFDDDPENDHRLLAGLQVTFQPRGVPGLSLGGARSYVASIPPGGRPLLDYLQLPYTDVTDNPNQPGQSDNQLLGLFGRWVQPRSGIEVYGELFRDDHWLNWEDLATQPDHALGYMLGFQKVITQPGRWIRVGAELAEVQGNIVFRTGRLRPVLYTHSGLRQGYTHQGHPLGAPTGPGSGAQHLEVDIFEEWGSTGAFLERVEYDSHSFYQLSAIESRDLELTAGAHYLRWFGEFGIKGELSYSHRPNRSFIADLDPEVESTPSNVGLALTAHWWPSEDRPGPDQPHPAETNVTATPEQPSPVRARPDDMLERPVPSTPALTCTPRALHITDLTDPRAEFARVAQLTGRSPLTSHFNRRPSGSFGSAEVCDRPVTRRWTDAPDEPKAPAAPAEPRAANRPDAGNAAVTPDTAEAARNRGARDLQIRTTSASSLVRMNSAYPRSRNDGALRAGRGISTAVTAGVEASWGPVTAALQPALYLEQNTSFATVPIVMPGFSSHVDPWHTPGIDRPQRFGESAAMHADWGQSYIRVDAGGVAAGLSNENLWWGPAIHHPLLLSNTAPGFPHLFVGTSEPADVGIGTLGIEAIWGRLEESSYYDADASNDHRLLGGLQLDFSPRVAPGLNLGAAALYSTYLRPDDLGVFEALFEPYRGFGATADEEGGDERVSFFGRWVFPESGFEFYGEWGREALWTGLGDLLEEPNHTQGYVLGLQKVLERDDGWVRLYGEHIHLQQALTLEKRGPEESPSFYTSDVVPHGHTHRGQLLGAAIGPGSDSQVLGADYFTDWGQTGLTLQRARYDDDAYYGNEALTRSYGFHGHDIELTAGVHQLFLLNGFDVSWGLDYSWRKGRGLVDYSRFRPLPIPADKNLSLKLRLDWRPGVAMDGAGLKNLWERIR